MAECRMTSAQALDPIWLSDTVELQVTLFEVDRGARVRIAVQSTKSGRLFGEVSFPTRRLPALVARLMTAEARAEQLGLLEHPRQRRRQERLQTGSDEVKRPGVLAPLGGPPGGDGRSQTVRPPGATDRSQGRVFRVPGWGRFSRGGDFV